MKVSKTSTFPILCLMVPADMFRALKRTTLPKEQVFAVTVGASSKRTLATWHLLAPADVIASITALNSPRYSEDAQKERRTRS